MSCDIVERGTIYRGQLETNRFLVESDLAVISKPKLVRKSASLSLTSPEKGTNFALFFSYVKTESLGNVITSK